MMAANGWMGCCRAEGIGRVKTKPGRGRRPILDDQADLERVHADVQEHRQKLSLARAQLEADLGTECSAMTLKRFLNETRNGTAAATSGCGNGRKACRILMRVSIRPSA